MKVAILGSRGVPANYGGFETFAEQLALGLVAAGIDVSVYCPTYQEYKNNDYKGIRLIFVDNYEYLTKNRILRAVANLLYDILSLIKVSFSDHEVVYMLGYASGPALIIPRLFGKTMVVNPDGLEWKSKRWGLGARTWLFLCEWAAARLSGGLIADAEPIRQHFIDKFNVDPVTIQYGAPILPKDPSGGGSPENGEYYVAVARMVPETSIPQIARGVLQSGTSRTLIIIGPAPDQRFLSESILPLVDGVRVKYLGPIYDHDLLVRYRQYAAALLHGHASDGTNPSLLESMGCASPVIAIRTSSNADVLGPNGDFYFGNEAELAEEIRRFESTDPDTIRALSESNRQTIEERFSWALCVRRHLDAFARFQR
jgi:glycosyltransferase involved in cell wall biosynthesis